MTELDYIAREIRKAEMSLLRAENKPNCNPKEFHDLKEKLRVLRKIEGVLIEHDGLRLDDDNKSRTQSQSV